MFGFDDSAYKRHNELVYELDRVIAYLKRAQEADRRDDQPTRAYFLLEAGRILLEIGPDNIDISTEAV